MSSFYTALEHGCNGIVFFPGGTLGRERLAVYASCSLSVCARLSVHYLLFYQVIMFSELKNMRGDADQVADVRNRRVNIFLPINPLTAKINNTRFGRIENALG